MEKEIKQHYLFGMHSVTEAILSGKTIEKVMIKKGLEGDQFRELMVLLEEKNITAQFVPIERLDRIKRGAHQGVIAFISNIEYVDLETLVEKALAKNDAPIFIMLDGVSDVRNFGAIARTSECAGVSGLILPAKGGAAINADAIKTSAGALLRIDTCKTPNLRLPIFYLKEKGFQIVVASEKSSNFIYDVDFKKPTVIVMGSEGKGVSKSVLSLSDESVKIPMMGEIGSLNVSVATSVVLYEAVRQRR
ncbi:MAG: 23S rRNA (guanosine(2251)-2'-O)-methyltransferase RlmB [Bacteroidales bacterium]